MYQPTKAVTFCVAVAAVAMGLHDLTKSSRAAEEENFRPAAGPLAPDSAIAKGYNDAAKALAEIDDNHMINWAYNVWCVTGYRTPREGGTNQAIDELEDPEKDLVTPKGFILTDKAKLMPPGGVRFMDNAWYFGTDLTGSIVVKVPEGLLMFDALTTPQDMQSQVIDQMRLAGLDPADFKYIFMGHSHGDHVGGANLVREKYAPDVKFVMGKPDAETIEAQRQRILSGDLSDLRRRGAVDPESLSPEDLRRLREERLFALPEPVDIQVKAFAGMTTGMLRIKVGDQTEVVAALVPGHTNGQLAAIVPVVYQGEEHKLVVWSGNDNMPNARQYATSLEFFKSIANIEGADAQINTHGYQGDGFKLLRSFHANPDQPNPIILGTDGVQRYLGIWSQCHYAQIHRYKDGTWKHM